MSNTINGQSPCDWIQDSNSFTIRKIDFVLYQGKVTNIFCPFLVESDKCLSPFKPTNRIFCYFKVNDEVIK